jgi:hypothetical protein
MAVSMNNCPMMNANEKLRRSSFKRGRNGTAKSARAFGEETHGARCGCGTPYRPPTPGMKEWQCQVRYCCWFALAFSLHDALRLPRIRPASVLWASH